VSGLMERPYGDRSPSACPQPFVDLNIVWTNIIWTMRSWADALGWC